MCYYVECFILFIMVTFINSEEKGFNSSMKDINPFDYKPMFVDGNATLYHLCKAAGVELREVTFRNKVHICCYLPLEKIAEIALKRDEL